MSDMLNHYYCGREALSALPDDSALGRAIAAHPDAYYFGTQGPDFFYYDIPRPGHLACNHLGSAIHTHRVDAFYYYGFQYTRQHPQSADVLLSYLAGFSCHHALDTISHPFIFYRTGRFDRTRWATHFYSYYHKYYEVLLDVAFVQYQYAQLAAAFNFSQLFAPDPSTVQVLEGFYAYVMRHAQGYEMVPGSLAKTIRSSHAVSFCFSDLNDYKKHALRRIERPLHEELALSRGLYPKFTDLRPVLNLDHEEWLDPCTGEPHHASYPELFARSLELTNRRFAAIDRLIADEWSLTMDAVHQIYGNRSYLTGIPCNEKQKMTHFDIIFYRHPHLQ